MNYNFEWDPYNRHEADLDCDLPPHNKGRNSYCFNHLSGVSYKPPRADFIRIWVFSALLLNFCQKKQEIGVGHMGCGFPALVS